MNPKIALDAGQVGLAAIVQMFNSYQQEETRRELVRTHYETLLEKFKLEQESLLRYYEMKFAERRESLQHFYWLLHQAVENGDTLQLQGALYGILDIIKTDPLADYEKFALAMRDPDIVLEI